MPGSPCAGMQGCSLSRPACACERAQERAGMCLCFGFCAFFWSWCVNLGRVAAVPAEWLAVWWRARGACALDGKLCPCRGTGMLRAHSPVPPSTEQPCLSVCPPARGRVKRGRGRGQRWGNGEAETGGLCAAWAECCSQSPARLWHWGAAMKCSSVEAEGPPFPGTLTPIPVASG